MNIICVDDEKLILEDTVSMIKEIEGVKTVKGYSKCKSALSHIKKYKTDVAVIDINMPDMDGISFAKTIKKISPDTAIIFLTGYSEYAVDAFQIHAEGYLLKPVSKERLEEELKYAVSNGFYHRFEKSDSRIRVITFGNFDIFADGKKVNFKRSKSKELLAYLIDRRGNSVTRAEGFAILWEDGVYDRSMQKQLDVIIRSLRDTLREYDIDDMLILQKGTIRIVPELIDCDMYRLLDGDICAIDSYRGEYMSQYSWASALEGYMTRTTINR